MSVGKHDALYRRLIHTARWGRLRRAVLSDHPLCQDCAADGLVTAAIEVHHVRPVEDAPTAGRMVRLMYDRSNLRALCHECHVRRHTELGRGHSRAAEERRRRAEAEDFRKRYLE